MPQHTPPQHIPISFERTFGGYLLVLVVFLIAWILVVIIPPHTLPPTSPLSGSNGLIFTQSLFNSALTVSTILITIAPVTFGIFNKDKLGTTDRTTLAKYLEWYMVFSIIVLIVASVLCSLCIAEMWYASSLAGSLFLLATVATGYLFLCFPRKDP